MYSKCEMLATQMLGLFSYLNRVSWLRVCYVCCKQSILTAINDSVGLFRNVVVWSSMQYLSILSILVLFCFVAFMYMYQR